MPRLCYLCAGPLQCRHGHQETQQEQPGGQGVGAVPCSEWRDNSFSVISKCDQNKGEKWTYLEQSSGFSSKLLGDKGNTFSSENVIHLKSF